MYASFRHVRVCYSFVALACINLRLRLRYLSVPMVTIFKNFTTMIITLGDYFYFGQNLSSGVIFSLFLMVRINSLLEMSLIRLAVSWFSCCSIQRSRVSIGWIHLDDVKLLHKRGLCGTCPLHFACCRRLTIPNSYI